MNWAAVGAATLVVTLAGGVQAQQTDDGLDAVVEATRQAWLQHDAGALVGRTDTVRLTLPDVAEGLSVKPAQAVRLLERYLKMADEQDLALRRVRRLAADHGYATLERRYVVRGTSETRIETVYVGFRRVNGEWRLREVRVAM